MYLLCQDPTYKIVIETVQQNYYFHGGHVEKEPYSTLASKETIEFFINVHVVGL